MSKTKRIVDREVFVPFEAGDEARDDLVDSQVKYKAQMDIINAKIDELKDQLKDPKEKFELAMEHLVKGKPVMVACQEIYDWDERKMRTYRMDNLAPELIGECDLTADAYQGAAGDEEF